MRHRWEYVSTTHEEHLEALGDDGWEAYAVVHQHMMLDDPRSITHEMIIRPMYYLKRIREKKDT